MDEKSKSICSGKTQVFLVCDKSLGGLNSPFYRWLIDHGYHLGDHHGNFGCWWMYVDITNKLYAYGLPGISMVQPIGNHAITIEEFFAIQKIYEKYEGKEVFVFNNERFDYED